MGVRTVMGMTFPLVLPLLAFSDTGASTSYRLRLRGHFERLEGLLEKLTQNHALLISQTIEPRDCFRRRLHVELLIPPCRMSPNSGPRRLVSQSSRLPTRKAVLLDDALDLLWLNAA